MVCGLKMSSAKRPADLAAAAPHAKKQRQARAHARSHALTD
jgi:hypothetical protein